MALWRVDVFANKDDSLPTRSGYITATNEKEAEEKVIRAMGSDPKAEAIKVRSNTVPVIPTDKVLWDTL